MCTTGPKATDEDPSKSKDKRPPNDTYKWFKLFQRTPSKPSVGGNLLRQGRFIDWFRWTFVDLDRHAADCRWAATLRRLPCWS